MDHVSLRVRGMMRRSLLSCFSFLLLSTLGAPEQATAQTQGNSISGAVRVDASTSEPAATVVQLTTLDGRTIVAVRPSSAGAFSMRSIASGQYRLRLLRVGFRPVEIDIRVDASDVTLGTLDGPASLVSLAQIRVQDRSDCVEPRANGRVGDLWGLIEVALASQLADLAAPASAQRWLSYEQRIDPRNGVVEQVDFHEEARGASSAFRPAPASVLAGRGFIAEDEEGFTFYLPVAETLLSPEFLNRYCFRVGERTPAAGDAPSLAFRPTKMASGRTDVSGEIAFALEGQQLDYVRFEYVNLPDALVGSRASGKVTFSIDANRTAIGSWWVDMPIVALQLARRAQTPASPGSSVRRTVTTARRRVGALRLPVSPCDTCPRDVAATVSGLLLTRDAASDDSSAVHTLLVAGREVRPLADERVIPWPPGRYEIRVATAWMAAHQVEESAIFEVADVPRPSQLTIGTLSRREVLRRACARSVPGGGVIGGTVRAVGGQPAPGVAVVAGTATRDGESTHITTTDDQGNWRICLPSGKRVDRFWAIADTDRAFTAITQPTDLAVVDLTLRSSTDPSTSLAAPSILRVRVRSESGEPIEGAEVRLEGESRQDERRRTDARGSVVFLVNHGAARISARRIGAASATAVVRVEPGRNAIGLVMFASRAGELDTVRVLGDRTVSARLDEFETRARRRQPNTVLRADRLNRYSRLSDALIVVPGVSIVDSAGVRQVRTNRVTGLSRGGQAAGGCRLRVILDGVPQPSDVSVDLGTTPAQLHGLEVYLSSSRIPPQYGGTLGPGECGLLVVWTKDGSSSDPR